MNTIKCERIFLNHMDNFIIVIPRYVDALIRLIIVVLSIGSAATCYFLIRVVL